jgi:hypothetical protein
LAVAIDEGGCVFISSVDNPGKLMYPRLTASISVDTVGENIAA